MRNYRFLTALTLPLIAAFALSSCAGKNTKKDGDAKTEMTADISALPSLEVTEGGDAIKMEGNIRASEFQTQGSLKTINFDYDRYELSDTMRRLLQANAELLKVRKEWAVLVEGHCDDRGTTEYNLALGQKRAKSVRDYYLRLGVAEDSIGTISYGEELPLCQEETDSCWLANRRAETKVKVK